MNLVFILVYEHCSWLLSLAGQQAEHPSAQEHRGFAMSHLLSSTAEPYLSGFPIWGSAL